MKYFLGSFAVGLLLWAIVLSGSQGCANPYPPAGGDRDSIPPRLILDETTPNGQVNFRPEEIVLTFDEWVVLKNPTQIVISPPVDLVNPPRLRKKSLIISFEDVVWQDSVTYTVNLGEAITDFTEDNPTENIRFVFSTGPELDSAEVRGRVVDAYTGEGKDGILVSLYANLADSAVTTQRPFYFGYTDEQGYYQLGNLKPDEYSLYALENAGGIYEYGSSTTGFGFLDTSLTIGDSLNRAPDVRLSPLPRSIQVDVDSSIDGQLKLGFELPATEVPVRTSRSDYLRITDGDTLRLFYSETETDTILVGDEVLGVDTITISAENWADLAEPEPLGLSRSPERAIYPGQTLALLFNRPLAQYDSTLVAVYRDTLLESQAFNLRLSDEESNKLLLRSNWIVGARYQVVFESGALIDYRGQGLNDSLEVGLSGSDLAGVGTLRLTVTGLDAREPYVVRLVNTGNDQLVETFPILGNERYEQTFERLPAATYGIEVIKDRNGNGRYDGGDWLLRRQPEVVSLFELEALRANWELEAEVSLEVE